MSTTDPPAKAGTGWTDHERLVYLANLIEHSDIRVNFKTAPLPPGRSVIACERMFGRLKSTLKAELDALKSGDASKLGKGGANTTVVARGRKRKVAVAEEGEERVGKKGKGVVEGEEVKREKEEEEEV